MKNTHSYSCGCGRAGRRPLSAEAAAKAKSPARSASNANTIAFECCTYTRGPNGFPQNYPLARPFWNDAVNVEAAPPAFVGYWFEWPPRIDLATIPGYNIIIVAFMRARENEIPTFSPLFMSDEEFAAAVSMLKCQGREVLISLGGAFNYVALSESDRTAFVDEAIRVIDKYGFTGMDLDLEGEAITAADNQTVIPDALIEIKNHYTEQGRDFMITMAPEFPNLRGADAPYRPYIERLEGYYDLISVQYYNQGVDGIWSSELGMWLSNNDREHKAEFIYTLTDAIVTGSQDYVKIPADKFAVGLPAAPEAAFDGYVDNPEDVFAAFDRLDREGNCVRGLMTWSVNFDAVNGYRFASDYVPLVFGRCGRCAPPSAGVCPPENLRASSVAYSSIGLEWDPCADGFAPEGYAIFRDNCEIARVSGETTSFLDTGLAPGMEYIYTVREFDAAGNYSMPSNELLVRTGDILCPNVMRV